MQDGWLAELLSSARVGQADLSRPLDQRGKPQAAAPTDWVDPTQGCGTNNHRLMISDPVLAGALGRRLCGPGGHATERGRSSLVYSALRQVVETAFVNPCDSFGLKYPDAHTTWGLITRIAAKLSGLHDRYRYQPHATTPRFRLCYLDCLIWTSIHMHQASRGESIAKPRQGLFPSHLIVARDQAGKSASPVQRSVCGALCYCCIDAPRAASD